MFFFNVLYKKLPEYIYWDLNIRYIKITENNKV